jgi:uncharacterized protein (TIGR02147 family)
MNIFNFNSYREYLNSCFDDKSLNKKKSELAHYLNCQPGFISQALSVGKTHFSVEHIYKVGTFFNLNEKEINFLILLLQYEKAGNNDLKKHFEKEIKKNQTDSKEIVSKIKKTDRNLSDQERAIYYSHWAYMAIHMAVSLPELNTVKALYEHFSIDIGFCKSIIQFLSEAKLIEKNGNKLSVGKTRIHLERTSPLVKSLHQNWRQKAIESLINNNELNLHYSSVLVLSKKDAQKIRSLILDLIKKQEEILIPSSEEEMVVFNLDYFKL